VIFTNKGLQMRDHQDDLTAELLVGEPTKKRGRKPKNPELGSMDAAKRKREQRARQAEAIQERDSHEWTEAECLSVLLGKQWRGSAIERAALEQLAKLRGHVI
jgi:hypothetical protein